MATLRGESVDRPPVCFYEINGYTQNEDNRDPFNIFNHPSWKPLLELAREKTDRIVLRTVPFIAGKNTPDADGGSLFWTPDSLLEAEGSLQRTNYCQNGSRYTRTSIQAGKRILHSLSRRDPDIDTIWTVEHLLKSKQDFESWLELPENELNGVPDISSILEAEQALGDTGIVAIDTSDPLCMIAPLFNMGDFTVMAMTEQELFHRALTKVSKNLYRKTEIVAQALPGRMWRIYGPEYAAPPYLPPSFFKEYVVNYIKPMVDIIHKSGGYARMHSHGRLKDILDMIVATGVMGLDPVEPPPQGDVELAFVREKYGRELVLFGNLEASDLEYLPSALFEKKIMQALREGTSGKGRGFVLMPSASPYGRILSPTALKNYEKMVECAENFVI